MHARQDVPYALERLAAHQAGVLSRDQVLDHGVSPDVLARLVSSGWWHRVAPGLFSLVPDPGWESLAWGGTLLGGPTARLGPEASGYLYGLVSRPPRPVDVLVPYERPVRVAGPWRFARELPDVRPGRSPGAPPRLTPECTVLDLANRRPDGKVAGLLTAAVQKRLTTPDRLRTLLQSRPRQRHRDLIAGMLTEVADGVESHLEMLYLRTVERPHELPRGRRQGTRAELPYRRDVDYDPYALLVELDGLLGHEGEEFRDMNRDNLHVLRSEATLRYGYSDVSGRPCPVAFQVHFALAMRGYLRPFRRCPRCVNASDADLLAG